MHPERWTDDPHELHPEGEPEDGADEDEDGPGDDEWIHRAYWNKSAKPVLDTSTSFNGR